MAFFDADEFLVLKNHNTVAELVEKYLPDNATAGTPEAAGALTIAAHWFGTSNHTMYAPVPVTKRFQYYIPNNQVKVILKVEAYGGNFPNPHCVTTRGDGGPRNWRDTSGFGNYSLIGANNLNRVTDVAVLHHYRFLSEREWRYKSCERGHVDRAVKECNDTAPVGMQFDDSAWKALVEHDPKYRVFENWPDYS